MAYGQSVVAGRGHVLPEKIQSFLAATAPQHALRLVTGYTPVEVVHRRRVGGHYLAEQQPVSQRRGHSAALHPSYTYLNANRHCQSRPASVRDCTSSWIAGNLFGARRSGRSTPPSHGITSAASAARLRLLTVNARRRSSLTHLPAAGSITPAQRQL